MIKAIETVYKGYRFRSRLEARWARFWDVMGDEYQYEPEGFDLDGVRYLPDFWLHPYRLRPGWGYWVEIKPTEATAEQMDKLIRVCVGTHHNGLMIQGNPWPGEFTCTKVQVLHYSVPVLFANWQIGTGVPEFDQPAFEAARRARYEYGENGQ